MRLDKFLQVSRLIKRRASANEACDAGRVQLNGRVAKAGSQVKPGDIITLAWGRKVIQVEVLEVPERVIPASQARSTYRLIKEEYLDEGELS